ncbi:MAG TPA: hypothetical protein VHS06_11300, partial [Chloroflexota bacterium]|nr:hypothetical protein [Chloroflexota bacterium]
MIRSFRHGWRVAALLWPVVLLSYLVDTALAALVAVPPGAQLSGVFGRSTMAPALLGPVSLDWLVEAFSGDGVGYFPWLLYMLVPLLYLLVGTFLRGGL